MNLHPNDDPRNEYSLGKDGFVWFFGVVEDRQDPEQIGRVRVRCYGWHTENKELIPTSSLPWAHIVQPPNLPASYTCKEGDYVFGFFIDGESAQSPMVLGVLPGKPESKPDYSKGFSDPNKKYPKRVKESTFSRLSRGNKYPYSYVHETESGHTFELDDNGKGRIKLSHNNGTYVEFDTDGNQINVVTKNNTVRISKDNRITVGGDCRITVDGDMSLSVGGALNIKAADINMSSDANINMKGTQIGAAAAATINMNAGAATKIKAGGILSMDGTMTTLSGGKVDVAGALVNIQMGSATDPDLIDIPDFEAEILSSIDAIPGVATGGGFLDNLKNGLTNVLDTVQTVVDVVQDAKAVYDAAKSGDIFGAIGGLSQLDPALGKALAPITETVDKVQEVITDVQNTVGEVISIVDDVGYIIGKDLYPKTSFLNKAYNTLENVSDKLDRVYTPINHLGDRMYDLYDSTYKIQQTRESVDSAINAVDTVINVYNTAAKTNKQIPTVSSRVTENRGG